MLALTVAAQPAPAKDPDIGFDYRAMVRDQMRLVADGKAKEAVEFLAERATPGTFDDKFRETLARQFALLFGGGGKFVGQEVVGYKRVTSRVYRFYAVAYFDRATVTFSYQVIRTTDAGWRVSNMTISDGVADLEQLAPFVPLAPPRDWRNGRDAKGAEVENPTAAGARGHLLPAPAPGSDTMRATLPAADHFGLPRLASLTPGAGNDPEPRPRRAGSAGPRPPRPARHGGPRPRPAGRGRP